MIALTAIYPNKVKNYSHSNTYTRMLTEPLFMITELLDSKIHLYLVSKNGHKRV